MTSLPRNKCVSGSEYQDTSGFCKSVTLEGQKHHRRGIRLKGYDYSQGYISSPSASETVPASSARWWMGKRV